MYDQIKMIIDHNYDSTFGGEQQYIYYICGALIIVLVAVSLDLIYRVFSHFWRSGK